MDIKTKAIWIYVMLYCGIVIIVYGIWSYDVELYGDIFQFLPLYFGIFMLYKRDYKNIILLLIVACITLGLTFLIKHIFTLIALHYGEEYAYIAKRPTESRYNAFPSGHTTSAFIALGFMVHFYTKRWVFPCLFLAVLVAFSRVITLWHTPLQVCAGAINGFSVSFLLTLWLKNIHFLKK